LAVGPPTNNDKRPPTHNYPLKAEKTMTQEKTLHHQVTEQMTKFEKTLQELHLLKRVSKDLKNYRKMIKLKKYD
jgi:division protein CdvB (Snf7/Vps24/ESCRT-III family)